MVLAGVVFACALGSHLLYVYHFAAAIPFWDQWDAEGRGLLRPWIEGTLRPAALFQPHNEHRIFPTRLLTLLVFELNGGTWNNLAETYVNALLYGSIPAFMAYMVGRADGTRGTRIVVLCTILVFALLPYGWENTLVGFQSQFYFVLLFTLPALALLAFRPEGLGALVLSLVLVAASALTMASGLLAGLAAAGIVALNLVNRRIVWDQALLSWVLLAAVAVIAYWKIPQIEGHQVLKASSLQEFAHAMLVAIAWPSGRLSILTPLIWAPAVLGIATMLFRRASATSIDYFMAGCVGWAMLQCAAIAHGRGHEMQQVPSRYSDLLVPGLIASVWFAGRLWQWAGSGKMIIPARALATLSITALAIALVARVPTDMAQMRERHYLSLIQTENVSAYLRDGDPRHLQQPLMHVPYPDANRLQGYLDDPILRTVLPFPEARGLRPQ
ncbi:MAG TPA: hypothetical protein DDZ67_00805 [Xanthomonadaceae bacterium]|nr:hypothetical protein [Xanthomonadaceae bacterium]